MRKGVGKAALAGLATFAIAMALVSPAQGARYLASVEMPEGPNRTGLVLGLGDEISIPARGTHWNSLSALYSGPGRTDRRGIFGRLGQFGSVKLRFKPRGKPRRTQRPRYCTGAPRFIWEWKGTFSGTVHFAPDANLRGFTRSGSFAGTLRTMPPWDCGLEDVSFPFNPDAGGIDVNAVNCDGRDFDANVEVKPATPPSIDEPPRPATFSASWTKTVGIAKVSYSISVEGGPDTAVFNDDLSQGTIRPPPPFHGEATILKQGDDWAWSGLLSARFPGRTVRLAGPGFDLHVTTYTPRPHTGYIFAYSVRC